MAILKIILKSQNGQQGANRYLNKINSENFREIATMLRDLDNYGLPIEKAIKEFKLNKSDWDMAIGS